MLYPTSNYICGGAALLGIISHLVVFIRGEWHMQSAKLVKLYSILSLLVFLGEYHFGEEVNGSLKATGFVVGSYSAGLFASIIIYRKYFHRLRHFPGPWAAGATKLWHVWQCRTRKNYLLIEKLRDQYGPIIRTGPEELTIIDPSVLPALNGVKNECTKAVWYDFFLPEVALNTTRDIQEHDVRRRVWDRGFSTKALTIYEERIVEYAEVLAARIEDLAHQEAPVNVSDWFHWFTFDVMGEFAFARSFGMLRDEKWHTAVELLGNAMALVGPFSPVPWVAQIAFEFMPWMYGVRDWLEMKRWSGKRMDERIGRKVEKPDVSHWLIDASLRKGSLEADRTSLNSDAVTIVVAGSDTIAATLVFAFYQLACSPAHQAKLLAELRDVDIYDRAQLQRCTPHLTAIIHETLRLYPPVLTGGYRQSPPSGMTVNDTYIPGNTTIVAPRYSLGRLESSYECADQFVPERWTTRPEMVRDARGFAPFAQGRYGCVGKALAMGEMRFVVALLVRKFEVGFCGDDRGGKLFDDLRDQFTAAPGRLDLQFRVREPCA